MGAIQQQLKLQHARVLDFKVVVAEDKMLEPRVGLKMEVERCLGVLPGQVKNNGRLIVSLKGNFFFRSAL